MFGGIAELYSHVLVCEVLHPSAGFLKIMIAGDFIVSADGHLVVAYLWCRLS